MRLLSEESIDIQLEEFRRKEMFLSQAYSEVSPYVFYEDIFADLLTEVCVVSIETNTKHPPQNDKTGKRIQRMTVEDAIAMAADHDNVLLSGSTFMGKYISKACARDLCALIVDLDSVTSTFLLKHMTSGWQGRNGESLPEPNYIVNSGTGLHLYFVLTEPIPCYHRQQQRITDIYRTLAIKYCSHEETPYQIQWFGQGFRMVGGQNKLAKINRAYRTDTPFWDIDKLAKELGLSYHITRYGEEFRHNNPVTYGLQNRFKKKLPDSFYTSTLQLVKEKTVLGHRYTSLMALTAIAAKCGVPATLLKSDLEELVRHFNKGCSNKNRVRDSEIDNAMKIYNLQALRIKSSTLEGWLGWDFNHYNRHKGDEHYPRKKTDDMRLRGEISNIEVYASAKRDEKYPDGSWRNRPRPKGRKNEIIAEWRKENPGKTKTDCFRDTGISLTTIRKWWN